MAKWTKEKAPDLSQPVSRQLVSLPFDINRDGNYGRIGPLNLNEPALHLLTR